MLELTDRRVLLGHGLQRDTFIKAGASHRRARVLWANWGSEPRPLMPPTPAPASRAAETRPARHTETERPGSVQPEWGSVF